VAAGELLSVQIHDDASAIGERQLEVPDCRRIVHLERRFPQALID
jgi:hypothetical protein